MRNPPRNFISDSSGRKYPISEARKMWDGTLVHKSEWEPRQPQDYIPPVRNKNMVKESRPDSDPVFVTQISRDVF